MLHIAVIGLLLFAMWLLLSGHYNMLLLSFGMISTIITLYLSSRLCMIDREGHPIHILWKMLQYIPWLLWKIVVSNIDVARLILSSKANINPAHTWIYTRQTSDLGKVIYANSITLTPGTIAIDVKDDQIEIHALTADTIEDLRSGEMDRRVADLMDNH